MHLSVNVTVLQICKVNVETFWVFCNKISLNTFHETEQFENQHVRKTLQKVNLGTLHTFFVKKS